MRRSRPWRSASASIIRRRCSASTAKAHAYERFALLYAAANPFDRRRMVWVIAGNDALDTVKLASSNLP